VATARYRHDPLKNLVGFLIGDVHYALPIDQVREIVNPLSVVSLPNAAPWVSGVSDYRDEVVPVVDLRTRFGLIGGPPTRRTKWILVDVGARLVALIVDSVTEVFGTGGKDLRPAPALGGGEDVRGIAGVTSYEERMVFVLDTSRFGELTESLVASGAVGSSGRSFDDGEPPG
jgi:purine-binding chemotaxis protein CheW